MLFVDDLHLEFRSTPRLRDLLLHARARAHGRRRLGRGRDNGFIRRSRSHRRRSWRCVLSGAQANQRRRASTRVRSSTQAGDPRTASVARGWRSRRPVRRSRRLRRDDERAHGDGLREWRIRGDGPDCRPGGMAARANNANATIHAIESCAAWWTAPIRRRASPISPNGRPIIEMHKTACGRLQAQREATSFRPGRRSTA